MQAQYGDVSARTEGHVAVLEFNRPPTNFVSVELVRALADALHAADDDKGVRASVVCSAGKAFCAGADLASPTGVGGSGMQGINPLYHEAVRLFSVKKPIVMAVQGAAVGAGLGLALVGDFRIAAPEARFVSNFVKLGFHPGFGITHTLPRVVGEQKALLMCLTGRRVKAEEALAWGLVDEVVPLEDLRPAALRLAQEIAENAPLAVQATRKTFRADLAAAVKAQTDHELVEQTWLRETKDFAEGVRSVNERRPGNFVGA
ncbi:enoyl-CoA hydratase/isomerase family protein [Caulobacter sp. KR2-114]|uniref:enoyl-CoA hydratase/isomerase family protein n=1 Tax=Caulobacter sp. KR2-114 TaxID=3400912 RepID=UPI003C014F76